MFCKWCGASIPEYQTMCPQCGKEQPPLADCGGFFNLVPQAKRNATASMPQEHRAAEPISGQRREISREENAAHKRKKKRSNLPGIIATCIALAALLVAVISSAKTGKKLKQMENELHQYIVAEQETAPQMMTENAISTEENAPEVTTTEQHTEVPTKATEPDEQLFNKVIEAEYHFNNGTADVKAGKEENKALRAVLEQEDGEYRGIIKYRNEDWIEIEIALKEGQTLGDNPVLQVEYELKNVTIDGQIFCFKDPSVSAKWRPSVVDPWAQLDGIIENGYPTSQNKQSFEIPIELPNIGGREFGIEITMENNQGGCCIMRIDGICFNNND